MKTNITVSLCISNDFEIEVEDCSPKNLYDAFIVQYGFPTLDWKIDDLEIISNE